MSYFCSFSFKGSGSKGNITCSLIITAYIWPQALIYCWLLLKLFQRGSVSVQNRWRNKRWMKCGLLLEVSHGHASRRENGRHVLPAEKPPGWGTEIRYAFSFASLVQCFSFNVCLMWQHYCRRGGLQKKNHAGSLKNRILVETPCHFHWVKSANMWIINQLFSEDFAARGQRDCL